MGMMLPVSFKQTEKNLWSWILEHKNELAISDICKKALMEKKAEWDAIHSENPANLHKRIDDLRKTLEKNSQKFNAFIDSEKLTERWVDFYNNDEIKPKKQKGFVTETIESNPKIAQ